LNAAEAGPDSAVAEESDEWHAKTHP